MAGPSAKHYEFAREIAKGSTITDAAIKAGFTEQTANKHAYKWLGKTREESMYPELWDLVQELKKEANDDAAETIRKMSEVLQRIWYEGYDTRWLFHGEPMPFAVDTKDKLMAMSTHQKLLPAPAQESTVHLRVEDFGDFGNLSPEEKIQLFELMKKAKKKEES